MKRVRRQLQNHPREKAKNRRNPKHSQKRPLQDQKQCSGQKREGEGHEIEGRKVGCDDVKRPGGGDVNTGENHMRREPQRQVENNAHDGCGYGGERPGKAGAGLDPLKIRGAREDPEKARDKGDP